MGFIEFKNNNGDIEFTTRKKTSVKNTKVALTDDGTPYTKETDTESTFITVEDDTLTKYVDGLKKDGEK